VCAGDHRRSSGRGPAAIGAEVGAPDERGAAGAAGRRSGSPDGDRSREQCVQLLQPLVERDQLVAPLDEQILAELVAPEHLQHQPAEVAQALLANPEQGATLPSKLTWMGQRPAGRPRGRRADGGPLTGAAETSEQRGPRHANQCNSEI
jgi:hypothetical protein